MAQLLSSLPSVELRPYVPAELFDPTTNSFTAAADMTAIRESHTATLLGNGQVLIVGGSDGTLGFSPTTTVLATAELY